MRQRRLESRDNPQEMLTGLERQRIATTVRNRSLELPFLATTVWVYWGVNENCAPKTWITFSSRNPPDGLS
jgi:hypothetical protein